MEKLPKELRSLVRNSVNILGHVIRKQAGNVVLNKVERLRNEMKDFRSGSEQSAPATLQRIMTRMKRTNPDERIQIAHAFALMLELINTCETAYRTYRLRQREDVHHSQLPEGILFVVTAHPTEARSPQMVNLFQQIQVLLINALATSFEEVESEIEHLLHLVWSLPASREKKPTVEDEATGVFEIVLRHNSILGYIDLKSKGIPFKVRSWIGGDKDGHPGVNISVTRRCLTVSRLKLVEFISLQLQEVENKLNIVRSATKDKSFEATFEHLKTLRENFHQRRKVEAGDGVSMVQLHKAFEKFCKLYETKVGVTPIQLNRIREIFGIFPALVVPIEVRETADSFEQTVDGKAETKIYGMLKGLRDISRGGEPTWYVAGMVISHTESIADLKRVVKLQRQIFKDLQVPIIPLFESEAALANGRGIAAEFLEDEYVKVAIKDFWDKKLEVMVGYSDSAKQSGTLPSRLMISKALHGIDQVVAEAGCRPVFFHGSGGSIARGGGSLQDQTEWWPKSALESVKLTVQGEMIQRTFASREILNGQLNRLIENYSTVRPANKQSPALEKFCFIIKEAYREKTGDPAFLSMVAEVTPYRFLKDLKIGSRPAKRSQGLAFSSLRAIPWVLCWTQTRVLFPVWWGVGRAWTRLNDNEKERLESFYSTSALFRSFVKQLGFTLEKVELQIFRMYLEQSDLPKDIAEEVYSEFRREYKQAQTFVRAISGERDMLWFRPWLKDSIHLRSSMIHPLNILQIIASQEGDMELLRETVTGVAAGMMTTG